MYVRACASAPVIGGRSLTLPAPPALEELHVAGNRIRDVGARALFRAVKRHPRMRVLRWLPDSDVTMLGARARRPRPLPRLAPHASRPVVHAQRSRRPRLACRRTGCCRTWGRCACGPQRAPAQCSCLTLVRRAAGGAGGGRADRGVHRGDRAAAGRGAAAAAPERQQRGLGGWRGLCNAGWRGHGGAVDAAAAGWCAFHGTVCQCANDAESVIHGRQICS